MGHGKHIGRSAYWLRIVGLFVAMMALLAFAFGAFVTGNFGTALLCVALFLPAGIYFRIVQMRRCRDIGWPAFLPWVIFGVLMLNTASTFSNVTSAAQLMTGSAMSMVLSLADFVFMVVIGCIAGRSDAGRDPATDSYGSVTLRHGDDVSEGGGDDPYGDAIARAMGNYRRTGSAAPGQAAPVVHKAPQAAARPAIPPRVAGFGRKAV